MPLLDRLKSWLAGDGRDLIERAVRVSNEKKTAYRDQTEVEIDHRLPDPGRGHNARWRITTRAQFLPAAHFDRAVRARINSASMERGRRVYAIDLASQEVAAALSYHLDERNERPLLITALGTRADEAGNAELFSSSLAMAWLLKQYAHVIAEQCGRGSFVDMDASTKPEVIAVLQKLGFRNAPRVPGFTPSGRHLRQDAVSRR